MFFTCLEVFNSQWECRRVTFFLFLCLVRVNVDFVIDVNEIILKLSQYNRGYKKKEKKEF